MISNEERDLLLNEIKVHYEQTQNLSPLAARIYSMLILCPKPGHTFDEILEYSGASKSSVSTSINFLLDSGNIEYFTNPGERKRYFKLSKNYLDLNLQKRQKLVENELTIFKKVQSYGNNLGGDSQEIKRREDFRMLYITYLKNQLENIESYRTKMNELYNNWNNK